MGELADLLLPPIGVGFGKFDLADHAVQDQLHELILVDDVPVQTAGAGVQLLDDAAHRETVPPHLVEHAKRRGDDCDSDPRRSALSTFDPRAAGIGIGIGGLTQRLLLLEMQVWIAAMGWLAFRRGAFPGPSQLVPARRR